MRNFQEKKGWKYYLHSKLVLTLLFILLLLFAWNVFGLIGKLEDTYKNRKSEEAKITDLEKRKAQLSSDIEKLNTDKGKEEVIRQNFGLAKEGEQLIVIVDDKNKTASVPQPENGFLSWLKNIFK